MGIEKVLLQRGYFRGLHLSISIISTFIGAEAPKQYQSFARPGGLAARSISLGLGYEVFGILGTWLDGKLKQKWIPDPVGLCVLPRLTANATDSPLAYVLGRRMIKIPSNAPPENDLQEAMANYLTLNATMPFLGGLLREIASKKVARHLPSIPMCFSEIFLASPQPTRFFFFFFSSFFSSSFSFFPPSQQRPG
jgi:hypothetical protein